jgi:hypothetical protein
MRTGMPYFLILKLYCSYILHSKSTNDVVFLAKYYQNAIALITSHVQALLRNKQLSPSLKIRSGLLN